MTAAALTAQCMAKIRYTVKGQPEALADHLANFDSQIEPLILTYITQAQKSERNTISAALARAGHSEAAAMVKGHRL